MPGTVSVVGLGRIGLPLALSFADRGLEVTGVDKAPHVLESIAAGHMPFEEPGAQELLERVLAAGRLKLTDRIEDAAACEQIVLTLGTPAFSHIEIDISDIRSVTDDLLPLLREGHSLILRSTSRSPRSARARPGCCWRCRAFTRPCPCSWSKG
jgi:UDP-N-acetyl-D-mannosaminuronic acid dehydrogenase